MPHRTDLEGPEESMLHVNAGSHPRLEVFVEYLMRPVFDLQVLLLMASSMDQTTILHPP